MTTIAIVPFVLKDCKFKVAADNYEGHTSAVEFVPTASTVVWNGLTPAASFTDVATATWVCNVALAQDWETTDSLSRYLFENEGEAVEVEFEPVSGGTGFEATIVITPGSIGGSGGAVAVASVSLGVRGRPAEIVIP
jgi:hypothetical protein